MQRWLHIDAARNQTGDRRTSSENRRNTNETQKDIEEGWHRQRQAAEIGMARTWATYRFPGSGMKKTRVEVCFRADIHYGTTSFVPLG